MSGATAFSCRRAVPVSIGGIIVYCESFRATAARVLSEESTADGGTAVTNSAYRSTRLVFSGRVCTQGQPEDFILGFNGLVHSAADFTVEYMGLIYGGCRMLSYSFEDKGGEWAEVSVTAVTEQTVERRADP
jgi:hypothetical protein